MPGAAVLADIDPTIDRAIVDDVLHRGRWLELPVEYVSASTLQQLLLVLILAMHRSPCSPSSVRHACFFSRCTIPDFRKRDSEHISNCLSY